MQDSSLLIVQELCTTDLSKLLEACYAPVPPPIAKALIQQLLLGLAACHDAGGSLGPPPPPPPPRPAHVHSAAGCRGSAAELLVFGATLWSPTPPPCTA
jgi:serine/threonine protein kinase